MLRGQVVLAVFGVLLSLSTPDAFGATVAIDFEESPRPDLTRIENIYRGGVEYLYAFLIVRETGAAVRGHVRTPSSASFRLL
jgi:hypothetical protein